MERLIGALAALVALMAGILNRLEPIESLQRAAIAFTVGWMLGKIWHGLTTVLISVSKKEESVTEGDPAP